MYNSKITFIFDNHYSMHEPSVEIQEKITNIENQNKKKKKVSKKKKRVIKKKIDVNETKKIKYRKKN